MIIYELVQLILALFFRILKPIAGRGKTKRFCEIRSKKFQNNAIETAKNAIKSTNNSKNNRVFWLHVASAGELEQAIPPLKKLVEELSAQVFVSYFSPSAEPFLKNVPGLVASMGFPADVRFIHRKILKELKITDVIFVRYDLWPALILAANSLDVPIHLFAATARNAKQSRLDSLRRRFKAQMFSKFQNIFPVTPQDTEYFKGLKIKAKIETAGDPKWGRALERAKSVKINRSKSKISGFFSYLDSIKRERGVVIFGSPHREEHEVSLALVREKERIFQVYVPHETSKTYVEALHEEFSNLGFRCRLFSELNAENFPPESLDMVIVDKVGFLAELYSAADAAIVGGGFDGQVHNTLEPAAHPVATLFGQSVERAQEAKDLLQSGGALGFATPQDMVYFIERCFHEPTSLTQIRTESSHPLAVVRQRALSVFQNVPNTSEIIYATLSGH